MGLAERGEGVATVRVQRKTKRRTVASHVSLSFVGTREARVLPGRERWNVMTEMPPKARTTKAHGLVSLNGHIEEESMEPNSSLSFIFSIFKKEKH